MLKMSMGPEIKVWAKASKAKEGIGSRGSLYTDKPAHMLINRFIKMGVNFVVVVVSQLLYQQ